MIQSLYSSWRIHVQCQSWKHHRAPLSTSVHADHTEVCGSNIVAFFLTLWVLLAPLMWVFWVWHYPSCNFLKYAVNVQQNQQVLNWHCLSFITKPVWYTSPFVLTNYRDYRDQYLYIFRCHTAKTTTTVQCRTLLPRAAFLQSIRSAWFYQQISIER